MADRKCSFCSFYYTDKEGHDYDKCVERCKEQMQWHQEGLKDIANALAGAIEVQRQLWWRRGVEK